MSETPLSSGVLRDGVHDFAVRVYFEDTDAGGIVYHANYLRFAERARTEMLRQAGFDQSILLSDENDPLAFVVRRCVVDYLGMARLDDLLSVRTRVVKIGRVKLEMEQCIHRALDGTELVRMNVVIACVGLAKGKAVCMPGTFREALAPYGMKEQV